MTSLQKGCVLGQPFTKTKALDPSIMKIAGIVCEYNPFHRGHAYQIEALKQQQGVDAVVCAMSGSFLQRGEPALLHKQDRAAMAVHGGADLVLELPVHYSTRSAYWFALGGLKLLAGTGIVTHLAFGAETNELKALEKTAQALNQPSPAFTRALKAALKDGHSFVASQSQALLASASSGTFVPLLPNDRLALSYLQVIDMEKLPFEPILIPRKGAGYLDESLYEPEFFASASAVRKTLEMAGSIVEALQQIQPHLPKTSFQILADIITKKGAHSWVSPGLVFPSRLHELYLHLLRRSSEATLRQLPDMEPGLEKRLLRLANSATSFPEFLAALKTRRFPYTRLMRLLLHLYLDYRESDAYGLSDGPPYLRVLAFNQVGQSLLRKMEKESSLPIITRAGQLNACAKKDPWTERVWTLEQRAGALYGLLLGQSIGLHPEFLVQPYIYKLENA